MLGKPRILSLFPTNLIKSIKHEHSCKILYKMDCMLSLLFFITSGLLIPAYSRIHVDKEWIEDHIPITSRYVQFIVVNDNILKKRSLLAVS